MKKQNETKSKAMSFKNNKQKLSLFKNLERTIVPDDNKDYSS